MRPRSDMNIGQFDEYCNEKFELKAREQKIQDKRKRPWIPAATIVKSIREMPVLGQTSLLNVDQYARSPEAIRWHESKKKDMVVSDTTLTRVLAGIDPEPIVEMPYEVVKRLEKEGYWDWKLSSGRKIRAAGIMDGSNFGGFWASVLMLTGKSDVVVDLEPYEKRGKELIASRKVLRRANEKLGREFFDLILLPTGCIQPKKTSGFVGGSWIRIFWSRPRKKHSQSFKMRGGFSSPKEALFGKA